MRYEITYYSGYYKSINDYYAADDPTDPDGAQHLVKGGYLKCTEGLVSVMRLVVE